MGQARSSCAGPWMLQITLHSLSLSHTTHNTRGMHNRPAALIKAAEKVIASAASPGTRQRTLGSMVGWGSLVGHPRSQAYNGSRGETLRRQMDVWAARCWLGPINVLCYLHFVLVLLPTTTAAGKVVSILLLSISVRDIELRARVE
jgi:hypothetical protein